MIALLVMATLLLLGTSFLTTSSTETEIARNARDALQAFYLSEAGVARLKRDLLAQFAVPYRNQGVCPNWEAEADLTRPDVFTEEPLGLAGQAADGTGSAACPALQAVPYYPLLDAAGQSGPPAGSTWRRVPYVEDRLPGSYRVEVRNATVNTIEARVTAFTDSTTRASRQIAAQFRVERFSPAEHALFVEGGIWPLTGQGGRGNLIVAGPVFVRGWSASYPALQLGWGDVADQIVNHYKDLDATLQGAVILPPGPPAQDVDLHTNLRVYQGPVEISHASASVGEPTVGGNGAKEGLKGVYTVHGFTGSPGAAAVYSDNGAGARFDLPREAVAFPDLVGPYTGAPLGAGAPPASHDAYLRADGLAVGGDVTIDKSTPSFSYPPGLSALSQCAGNCLIYREGQDAVPPSAADPQGSPAVPPTLLVKGITWVQGNIALGGVGADRLPAIRYQGGGTLYARPGSTDGSLPVGLIEITSNLLPPAGFPPTSENNPTDAQFPTHHRLGLISSGGVVFGDWNFYAEQPEGTMPPTLKVAATVFANQSLYDYWPYQIAGSVMARSVYAWKAARIYYLPGLAGARPPGMPGVVPPKAAAPFFVRTLSWRDVVP